MRKFSIEMPPVGNCTVERCAYNVEQSCHAKAITIGDEAAAACDTFFTGAEHAHNTAFLAGVGACKVTDCRHNEDLECGAEKIKVGLEGSEATCLTFEAR